MGKGRPPPSSPSHDIENGISNRMPRNERKMPPLPPPPEPWTPWLMSLVFVADIAVFVYTMYVNDCPHSSGAERCLGYGYLGRFSFQRFKENPLLGPSYITLKKLGALDWKLVVEEKEYWRLVSCIWFHAGVVHLLVNMISLLFLGIRLEQEFGFLRIGPLYMISGLGGSLASALSQARKKTISVGASGALFGLLGAMLSELFTNWSNYTNKCSALSTMVLIICLNLAVGFLPQVDNSAHIGGFVSGVLAGFVLLMRPQFGYISPKHVPKGYQIKHKVSKHLWYQYVFFSIAFVLLIIGFAVGFQRLLAGKTL
ncbi:RHOMBOID-like protein 5 [Hibiscus trionum]|uniref:RHOMBOID-like protein n=1 Tax=Hibiscus trionum TaxID=183268 RepID=A0A9W7MW63_HIBTR|nr:RHOMBOID-like protein 5 [Hibiscus trionum]